MNDKNIPEGFNWEIMGGPPGQTHDLESGCEYPHERQSKLIDEAIEEFDSEKDMMEYVMINGRGFLNPRMVKEEIERKLKNDTRAKNT